MHPADRNDPRVATVIKAAAAAEVVIEPVSFDNETRTSADAAREIGCEVDLICKSLIFECDGEPFLFLMSGSDLVDLSKAAAAAGVPKLERADAERAKRHSGFSIGATPPFGHSRPLKVFIDKRLVDLREVWASGGRTDTVFPISTADLVAVSGAIGADLRKS